MYILHVPQYSKSPSNAHVHVHVQLWNDLKILLLLTQDKHDLVFTCFFSFVNLFSVD